MFALVKPVVQPHQYPLLLCSYPVAEVIMELHIMAHTALISSFMEMSYTKVSIFCYMSILRRMMERDRS